MGAKWILKRRSVVDLSQAIREDIKSREGVRNFSSVDTTRGNVMSNPSQKRRPPLRAGPLGYAGDAKN